MKMEGVYTALITPFDENDHIDEKALIALLRRQYEAGVAGVVVLGTTGEASTLDSRERDLVIKAAVTELKGKLPVVVGCSSPSTKEVISFARAALALGADCLQIATPCYNRPTQEGIFLHFKAISEAVSLPICVYNIPSRTGQNIETETLARIVDLRNVICVKEASGNLSQMADIIEKIVHRRPNFTIISGDDPLTLPLISIGGHGVMSVISNLVPQTMKRLVQAAQEGDFTLARAIYYSLKPLMHAAFIETNPIPIKFLMHKAGLSSPTCRLPLCPPTSASAEKISQIYEASYHLIEENETQSPF